MSNPFLATMLFGAIAPVNRPVVIDLKAQPRPGKTKAAKSKRKAARAARKVNRGR